MILFSIDLACPPSPNSDFNTATTPDQSSSIESDIVLSKRPACGMGDVIDIERMSAYKRDTIYECRQLPGDTDWLRRRTAPPVTGGWGQAAASVFTGHSDGER